MILRVVALSFTLLLALSGTKALALPIPPGTYAQSCTNARVRGAQLIANCSAPNGQRIVSSTGVVCRGDIGNVNGYLRCNGRPGVAGPGHIAGINRPGFGGGLPAGSYRQTCRAARMQGTVLVANCDTGTGGVMRASLNTATCRRGANIGNQNGVLYCR